MKLIVLFTDSAHPAQ